MNRDSFSLLEYFDHALREIYSLEELLESVGQHQTADVLRSVVEMAYGKLCDAEAVIERDVGRVHLQLNDYGEPMRALVSLNPNKESYH